MDTSTNSRFASACATSPAALEQKKMGPKESLIVATIINVSGTNNIVVKLSNGEEISTVLDAAALRQRRGRVYGIKIGGSVTVALGSPSRIIDIEQESQLPPAN